MKGVYTAEAKLTAWASAKGAMLLTNSSTKVLEIISAHIGDVGTNVTNQQLEASLARVTALGSPVGTSVTPNPEEAGDAASGVTVTAGLTTDVTTKGVSCDHQGFASLAGYQYNPLPEERMYVAPSASVVLYLVVVPTAFDAVVQVKYREIG
jgi:hypothetical protein